MTPASFAANADGCEAAPSGGGGAVALAVGNGNGCPPAAELAFAGSGKEAAAAESLCGNGGPALPGARRTSASSAKAGGRRRRQRVVGTGTYVAVVHCGSVRQPANVLMMQVRPGAGRVGWVGRGDAAFRCSRYVADA
jgi:hypothetical protein